MIWDVIILFGSGVAATIILIVGQVTLAMPAQFQYWLNYVFGFANVFKGIFAVADLMSAVVIVVVAWTIREAIVLFFQYIWPLIPYFGARPITPFSREGRNTLDLRDSANRVMGRNEGYRKSAMSNKFASRNVIDLRKGRIKTRRRWF